MSYTFEHVADISAYQNGSPAKSIDFTKMAAEGISGVIIRKSLGYYQDTSFVANWAGAGAAGLKRGVYYVPFVKRDDLRQLAALQLGLDPLALDYPVGVDLERSHTFGLQAGANTAIWHLTHAKAWTPAGALAYTGKHLWESWYSRAPGWVDDWELWVANYGSGIPVIPIGWQTKGDGTKVTPMKAWRAWQYSADGNGLGKRLGCWSGSVDLSWWKVGPGL